MKWLTKFFRKQHTHYFNLKDVLNTKIDPICECGITLNEANEEKSNKQ